MYITNNGKATIEIKATGNFLEEIKKELEGRGINKVEIGMDCYECIFFIKKRMRKIPYWNMKHAVTIIFLV